MTKLIWVAVLAVGCGVPFEADLFGDSLDADGGALDVEIAPPGEGDATGDARGDALPEVDGGAGGSQPGAGGAGGVAESAGGRSSTGGMAAAGGAPSAGGSSSGGAPGAGGAASGGASAGGAPVLPCDGVGYVTHDNGLGQTWEDCVPQGTHDGPQARAACEAHCASQACVCSSGLICPDVYAWLAWVDGKMVGWAYTTLSGLGTAHAGEVWSGTGVLAECRVLGTWD